MPTVLEAIRAARRRSSAPPAARKAIEFAAPLRAPGRYGRPLRSTWSMEQAIDSQFKGSVLVYRAVVGLASALGSVRWVAEVLDGGTWRPDESHDLQGLLNQPHQYFPRQDFNEVLAMFLALAGNALFQKTTASGKLLTGATRPRIIELTPLIPEGIEPVPDETEWIRGYEYHRGGKHLKWKADEILHFMVRDPSNLFWGLSPLKAARGVIRMDVAAVDWNTESLNNRAVPDGVYTSENTFSAAQYEELQDQLYDQHTGPDGAHLPMLIGGAQWQETSRSPVEMDFIETRKMTREDILSALGMPPVVAGYFEQATLANAEVSRRLFWEDNVIPSLVERVAGGFNANVVPHFGDSKKLRVGYDISGIPALREDLLKKSVILGKLVQAGTPYNQAIAELELDLDPIPGAGDVPFGLEMLKRPPVPEQPPPQEPKPEPVEEEGSRTPAQEEEREEDGAGKATRPSRRKAVSIATGIFTTAIADGQVDGFRRAFLALLKLLRGDVSLGQLREALGRNDGAFALQVLGDGRLEAGLWDAIGSRIELTVRQAAARAALDLQSQIGSATALDAGRLRRWLVPYLEERVAQLATTSRAAITETVAEFATGRLGRDVDAAAELVRGIWGLHRGQAAGVRNLVASLLEQGKGPAAATEQALRLARARLDERAKVIAEHESFTAAHRGNAMRWEQALDEGEVSTLFAMWVTEDDADVDEECLALEGREINIAAGERFPAEPPLHVGCRCGLLYSGQVARQ